MKKRYTFLILVIVLTLILALPVFAATGETVPDQTFGFAPVMAITVICYLVAAGLKATSLNNKWLPVICGVVGGILGIFAANVMVGFPAADPVTAIAIGIVSGLAATGINQVGKQLKV